MHVVYHGLLRTLMNYVRDAKLCRVLWINCVIIFHWTDMQAIMTHEMAQLIDFVAI